MRYLDIDLETDRTYDGFLIGKKGGVLDKISECAKATQQKFGIRANPNRPNSEQKAFMKACLDKKSKLEEPTKEIKEPTKEIKTLPPSSSEETNKTKKILKYTAIGIAIIGLYFLLKR